MSKKSPLVQGTPTEGSLDEYGPAIESKSLDQESLVEIVTKSGNCYFVPQSISTLSISGIIRSLTADGWSRWQIHKVTKIRYQHVRNVLEAPLKK